jgi:hypothetical protein
MAPLSRPHFEADGASPLTTSVRDTSSSSPNSPTAGALARFEFESGRGNEGTKILMVEWEDDTEPKTLDAEKKEGWEIGWEGKTTTLSARDGKEDKTHRMYFLLPPGTTIPPVVTLKKTGCTEAQEERRVTPLPAIFSPELGASARAHGKKGVLHTIWAKKRLSVLQSEIETEMRGNLEGVGLEMVLQEKGWIEDNFGVGAKVEEGSPNSPRTPGGGRLQEKLKGLKLGTSASDLARSSGEYGTDRRILANTDRNTGNLVHEPASIHEKPSAHPLSPETGDVAVSSFSLFHGIAPRPSNPTPTRAVAHNPPSHIVAAQTNAKAGSRMNSLDAITSGDAAPIHEDDGEGDGEGLFAVKMSPRSPEMVKSPFSFTTKETVPWLKDT